MPLRATFACLSMLSLACASARPVRLLAVAPDELLVGGALGAPVDAHPPLDDQQVLTVTSEMRAFLDRHVALKAAAMPRLRQLSRALLDADRFGLRYDERTRTAAEAFGLRRGNCLSFSNMFVAMARQVGLRAYFQEVDTPPDWSRHEDAFILNRHVNVVVDLRRSGEYVVDFNLDDFRSTYDRRRISDARALAHYHNNVAVERMRVGDTASAFLHFRRALERDRSFAPAWTNLGILYLREGHPDHAEAAYVQALDVDGGDLVAMSNLATLYARMGDHARAAVYQRRVAAHRNGNPYYRFRLAQDALRAGDYDAAIGHLKYAVLRKWNEDQFHFLLGLSYLRKGDERAARRWLARAGQVASSDSAKRKYGSKLEMLGRRRPEPQ